MAALYNALNPENEQITKDLLYKALSTVEKLYHVLVFDKE